MGYFIILSERDTGQLTVVKVYIHQEFLGLLWGTTKHFYSVPWVPPYLGHTGGYVVLQSAMEQIQGSQADLL